MAAFRFKLQTVLDLREKQQKESAARLARAREGADQARKARADLESVWEAGRARLAQAHGSGSPVGHLQNMAMVVGRVDHKIQAADVECRKAEEQVVESMKAFHSAFQQRSSIDKLRTRQLVEWRSVQTKTEQKAMDEVAIARHSRGESVSPGDK